MDRTAIRAWRRIQQKRVWRNRIKYYASIGSYIFDPELNRFVSCRDWRAYKKESWVRTLKTTATPCSCWLCRNYGYDRRAFKRDTQVALREYLFD